MRIRADIAVLLLAGAASTAPAAGAAGPLSWPIDCEPGRTCAERIGPDIDGDGKSSDCENPGYRGHTGTDIVITPEAMARGIAVRAAADGVVLWVFDGKHDACPGAHADCQAPPDGWFVPGRSRGFRVCTELGPWCPDPGKTGCFWCFDGANVVVIRHAGTPGVFATRYDHFKNGSIRVAAGDRVRAGQQIGEVGSAGRSTAPHLHFEVWGATFYDPVDPWDGACGSSDSLWKQRPPWSGGASRGASADR